jgi:thiamine-phosphate pyrophosphorylase
MKRRHPLPSRWLVADERAGDELWPVLESLPRGSGVLVLYRDLPKRQRAALLSKLRRFARHRGLAIADELAGDAARVHDPVELRQALLRGTPLLFLSPMFQTRSHPEWKPMARMRAAAMARLARVPVVALGGMNETRFRRVERLGFQGWAGIDAWIRT